MLNILNYTSTAMNNGRSRKPDGGNSVGLPLPTYYVEGTRELYTYCLLAFKLS